MEVREVDIVKVISAIGSESVIILGSLVRLGRRGRGNLEREGLG